MALARDKEGRMDDGGKGMGEVGRQGVEGKGLKEREGRKRRRQGGGEGDKRSDLPSPNVPDRSTPLRAQFPRSSVIICMLF